MSHLIPKCGINSREAHPLLPPPISLSFFLKPAIMPEPSGTVRCHKKAVVFYLIGSLLVLVCLIATTGYAQDYTKRGIAFYHSGDLEQAIADFTKAIELDPDDAKAYNNRGVAYRKTGDLEHTRKSVLPARLRFRSRTLNFWASKVARSIRDSRRTAPPSSSCSTCSSPT